MYRCREGLPRVCCAHRRYPVDESGGNLVVGASGSAAATASRSDRCQVSPRWQCHRMEAGRLSTPPCMTPYIACLRTSWRCAANDLVIQRCERCTLCSNSARLMSCGGTSSKGMMMSAPYAFCARTEDSGVRLTRDPSR
eukprot:scaffold3134_cov414-Prasinococcus_capsulatus_cf.AAC.21